jgi:DNA-binding response OmpR family regulator
MRKGGGMESGARVKRVLVVEDEPAISQVCLRVLSAEGFEVDLAENGARAQKRLKENDYDLCLIDIMTPIMDGKRLYRWIMDKRSHLVKGVIFTTGDAINPDTRAFLDRVDRPFLPKPFTLEELKRVVVETLGKVGE